MQSRYYNASVGRFTNSDDMGLHITVLISERYTPWHYCYNSPIDFIDECGYASSNIKDGIKSYTNETWISWVMNKFFNKVNNKGRLDLIPQGKFGLEIQLFFQIMASKGYKKPSQSSIQASFKNVSFKLDWGGKVDATIGMTISDYKVSFMRGIDWKKVIFQL